MPVELAEAQYPVHVERYGFVRDSGGAGKYRGGVAIEREWRLLSGEANLTIRSGRRDHLPYGLQGGGPGTPSNNILFQADGDQVLPTMVSTTIKASERIYHSTGWWGRMGQPAETNACCGGA